MSLGYLMESRPVSFEYYGTVAFHTGSFSSMLAFLRALGSRRFPVTRKDIRILAVFALATLYIAAMPTLFSAMTGYAAVSAPSILVPPDPERQGSYNCLTLGECTIFPCGGPGASGLASGGFRRGEQGAPCA